MRLASGVLIVALSIFAWAKTAWQAEWNEIVEAAKREGAVVVVGPQGNETSEALTLQNKARRSGAKPLVSPV